MLVLGFLQRIRAEKSETSADPQGRWTITKEAASPAQKALPTAQLSLSPLSWEWLLHHLHLLGLGEWPRTGDSGKETEWRGWL